MLDDNFRRRKPVSNRQRYLRYDDVFMSRNASKQRNVQPQQQSSWNDANREPAWTETQQEIIDPYQNSRQFDQDDYQDDYNEDDYNDYEESPQQPKYSQTQRDQNYFAGRNNILNERMVRYQKRQLPPLQRYSPNSHRDAYAEFNQSYWDEDTTQVRRQKFIALGSIWQKFIITFASILSLVCISWIAYNWNSNKTQTMRYSDDGIPVIEPEQSTFKVLPESPGGAEIAYRDKTVYNRVDNGVSPINTEEKLLPPQEETFSIPDQQQAQQQEQNDVEEYSIVSDKVYYIKLSAGKDKQILINEAKLLKKKYSELFAGKEFSVKKVSNSRRELQRAILIGPFSSQKAAIEAAREVGEQCYVISVRE